MSSPGDHCSWFKDNVLASAVWICWTQQYKKHFMSHNGFSSAFSSHQINACVGFFSTSLDIWNVKLGLLLPMGIIRQMSSWRLRIILPIITSLSLRHYEQVRQPEVCRATSASYLIK